MNNPFPTALQLRADAMIDRLLSEQETASASFRAAATAFLALLRDLHFPLGSPVHGYDLSDIEAALNDWAHNVRCPLTLEEIAQDIATERLD